MFEHVQAKAAEVVESAQAKAAEVVESVQEKAAEVVEIVQDKAAIVVEAVQEKAADALVLADQVAAHGAKQTAAVIHETRKHSSLFAWYNSKLESHPIVTKSLTTAAVGGLGDVLAQSAFSERYEPRRTLAMAGTGLIFSGPIMHFWFTGLNRWFAGTQAKMIATRLALDQFVFAPIFTPLSVGVIMSLEGRDDVLRALSDMYRQMITAGWVCWVPAQTINFALVPQAFQVLFVNGVSLGWSMYLAKATH
jgi:hypothetical protein